MSKWTIEPETGFLGTLFTTVYHVTEEETGTEKEVVVFTRDDKDEEREAVGQCIAEGDFYRE